MSDANRREFIKVTALATTGVGIGRASQAQAEGNSEVNVDFKSRLLTCLGGPWPDPCDLRPAITRVEQKDGYRLEWVRYEVEPGDHVPAILIVPDGINANSQAPAIAVWHQHNGEWHLGKSEPAGLLGNPMHHTGVALAKLGYVVLCPDALCFEERQDPQGILKDGNFERFEFLRYVVQGKCMAWKNILDMRRAVDYLVSRPEVNIDFIGCYGHSMGSTHAWLVGPWDERLKCVVGNCCLPTYKGIHRTKILHCFPNFIPGIFEYGDTPEIAALIAPRALHLNLGELDSGSPIGEAKEGIDRIATAYSVHGASSQFTHFIEAKTDHVLSAEMWKRVVEVFARMSNVSN
jgi:dienelactone hydrolase